MAAPTRREALTAIAGSTAVLGSLAVHGWGMARSRFDVEIVEVPVRIARLPRALDGFTIAQVSDVHVGPLFGERDLRRLEDLVRGVRADLVAMTGDLVDFDRRDLPLSTDWVARLAGFARHGAIAILGNHEYYVGRDQTLDAYRRAKVPALVNELRTIEPGLVVAGIDDSFRGGRGIGPRFEILASAPGDAARVVLCHRPHLIELAKPGDLDLMLSGHTHGGQIAPVGTLLGPLVLGPTAGMYDHAGAKLYVNRGLGTSGPPARVAVRPEITKIVLVAA